MIRRILFASLALFLAAGCQKKEKPKEVLEFTEESEAFTSDKAEEKITAIALTDITDAAGLDFEHVNGAFGEKWMPETVGSGGGFLDYNNDGWPDILLVNGAYWPGHETGGSRRGFPPCRHASCPQRSHRTGFGPGRHR